MLRAILIGLAISLMMGCEQSTPPVPSSGAASTAAIVHKLHGQTMGTTYNISLVESPTFETSTLQQRINQNLQSLNRSLSTYDPQSELSLINQQKDSHNPNQWIDLSPELTTVLSQSLSLYKNSRGYFDVTVGPLVNIWGFGPEEAAEKAPSDHQITQLLQQIGSDHISLDSNNHRMKLAKPVYIDLSAIAKGWGVDEISRLLEAQGIENYLVEIGGELRTNGHKPGDTPWKIAVEKPAYQAGERKGQLIIAPGNAAVATSGDYRNYFEVNGTRFSHTINPATGRPITHNLASVTVIHPDCVLADGWATALNVAGPEEGFALAQQHNLAAYFIIRSPQGFETRPTTVFEQQYGHDAQSIPASH